MSRFVLTAVAVAAAVLVTVTAAPWTMAAGGTVLSDVQARIPSFAEFIASIRSVEHQPFAPLAESKVADEGAFAEMMAHILKSYDSIDVRQVRHSFTDENGSIFDCIPVDQQPALRGSTKAVPKAPNLPQRAGKAAFRNDRPRFPSPLSPDRKDRYGNAMSCTFGTIPMWRITLDNLRRFKTLQSFFQKGPEGMGRARGGSIPQAATAKVHLYAHARQSVRNLGGSSILNIWTPPVAADQIFSLAQQWYSGGSDANLQTVEVGWQVFPQKYEHSNPVFFIFWTADNYTTQMCYNLDCPAFVQTDPSWPIGGALPFGSTVGGTQAELQVAYYLFEGNWWLQVNGTWIGYYPGSLFGTGALATGADEIDYGGETSSVTSSRPPMGSGMFANAGYPNAAYQRDIFYYLPSGGTASASLAPDEQTPWLYSVFVTQYDPPWNATIFFGGPGGTLQQ